MASPYKKHNPISIPKPKNESEVWNPKGAGKAPEKKLSAGMFAWAKANRNKLTQPTDAQKKIFKQYDAMKKAGDNPANPKPKPNAKPKPQVAAQPTPKPQAAANNKPEPNPIPKKPESTGNDKLKVNSIASKGGPNFKDYPNTAAGLKAYDKALAAWKKRGKKVTTPTNRVNRRGRRLPQN